MQDKKITPLLGAQATQCKAAVGAAGRLLGHSLEYGAGYRFAQGIQNMALDEDAPDEKDVFTRQRFSRSYLDGVEARPAEVVDHLPGDVPRQRIGGRQLSLAGRHHEAETTIGFGACESICTFRFFALVMDIDVGNA